MQEHQLHIDCTGNNEVIDYIISNCGMGSTILLIGTPTKETLLNALCIHRKNIQLIGGHEISDIEWQKRQEKFAELYEWHKNRIGIFNEFVQFHSYSNNTLYNILNGDNSKPFNVIKYFDGVNECNKVK